MHDLQKCTQSNTNSDDNIRPLAKVRIALLDTGVDHNHPLIQGLKKSGTFFSWINFVGYEADSSSIEATQDNDGHSARQLCGQ